MSRPSRPQAFLAAVLGWAALSAAQAEITTSARIERFGYRLVDLRPGDGIAPGIELGVGPARGNGGTSVSAYALAEDTRPPPLGLRGSDQDNGSDNQRMFAPLSAQAAVPGLFVSAAVSGSPHRHDVVIEAFGRMEIGPADAYARRDTRFGARASPATYFYDAPPAVNGFRITPYTRVVWSGHVELHTRMDATAPGAPGSTFGVAELRLLDGQARVLDAFRRHPGVVGRVPGQRDYVSEASVSFSNASAAPAVAFLDASVLVESRILPVPEPGSAALLLCGLGAVGLAARRGARTGRA